MVTQPLTRHCSVFTSPPPMSTTYPSRLLTTHVVIAVRAPSAWEVAGTFLGNPILAYICVDGELTCGTGQSFLPNDLRADIAGLRPTDLGGLELVGTGGEG